MQRNLANTFFGPLPSFGRKVHKMRAVEIQPRLWGAHSWVAGQLLVFAGSPAQLGFDDATFLYYALMHRKNPGHINKRVACLIV